MLLNTTHEEQGSARATVHNYYERVVFDEIFQVSERARNEPNFMADVACVALNHLPPRYVRHDVDMTFFLSPIEIDEIRDKVACAVEKAVEYVTMRDTQHPKGSAPA